MSVWLGIGYWVLIAFCVISIIGTPLTLKESKLRVSVGTSVFSIILDVIIVAVSLGLFFTHTYSSATWLAIVALIWCLGYAAYGVLQVVLLGPEFEMKYTRWFVLRSLLRVTLTIAALTILFV